MLSTNMDRDNPRIWALHSQSLDCLSERSPMHYFITHALLSFMDMYTDWTMAHCEGVENWTKTFLSTKKAGRSAMTISMILNHAIYSFFCIYRNAVFQSRSITFQSRWLCSTFLYLSTLCSQSEDCCTKLGSEVCTGQSTNCPNLHFVHNIYKAYLEVI